MKSKNLTFSGNIKYKSRNPVSRYLINNFYKAVEDVLSEISFESVLDIGCGEGIFLFYLQKYLTGGKVFAVDIDPIELAAAKRNISFANFQLGDVNNLPFRDKEFDLVICSEVLEHLNEPSKALKEVRRVTGGFCIMSVPNEPLWCFLNMVRGAYLSDYGNTPGHVNHWNRKSFHKLIGEYFDIIKDCSPLPWILVLGKPKG